MHTKVSPIHVRVVFLRVNVCISAHMYLCACIAQYHHIVAALNIMQMHSKILHGQYEQILA